MNIADSTTARRILKQGETFSLFDSYGDVSVGDQGELGLFHEGARFLSTLLLRLGSDRLVLLSSAVSEDNSRLTVHVTNREAPTDGGGVIPGGSLHFERTKCLWEGACYERIKVHNYGLRAAVFSLRVQFQADFADLFEVRGARRSRRGRHLEPMLGVAEVALAYEGLDGLVRRTRLQFSPQPNEIRPDEALFEIELPATGEATITTTVVCEVGTVGATPLRVEQALEAARAHLNRPSAPFCAIETNEKDFHRWLRRARADLELLITDTPQGPCPYAGIPWFSTAFGRDGIITALSCVQFNPGLARGVLAHLAETQAREVLPEQDGQPGKICHETRLGEMAALGEVPFRRYYGSVDATPLFVVLAKAYYERTGDRGFITALWPSVERALHWIDTYGDADGDGFVEYSRQSARGLVHQGWKDSHDAVFHADGTLANGPVALCEVQGYVYAAKRGGAALASLLGHTVKSAALLRQAKLLRERFERAFWCERLSTYALALDGRKRRCEVRASNAGQCLFTGIASRERAALVARTLLGDESFSGWGVRTLAESEGRYNPVSYHNGSVWPHDSALIADGLSRYHLQEAALKITAGLLDASLFFDRQRLPELFCGFPRRPGQGPVGYPAACAPQAWSAAAVFLLLRACLGLRIIAPRRQICFTRPSLPEFMDRLSLERLQIGDEFVDLLLTRSGDGLDVRVPRPIGNVRVIVRK